jgi:hypothetical protein
VLQGNGSIGDNEDDDESGKHGVTPEERMLKFYTLSKDISE